jgi:hypothetical protein
MSDVPAAKIALIGTIGGALIVAGTSIYLANRGDDSDPPADPVRVAGASVAVDAASFYVRCPFTVTFSGTIDVQSGAGRVVYRWLHSDGFNQPIAAGERQTVAVDGPGNVTLSDQWIANVPMGEVARTVTLEVIEPRQLRSNPVLASGTCDATLPEGPPVPPPQVPGGPPG